MDVITPKDIVEYNRTLVLDDSAMFRGAAIHDLIRMRSNPFVVIYWFFNTHYRDIMTKYRYNNTTTDPEYWIILHSYHDTKLYKEYKSWLKENNIKYHTYWYGGSMNDYGIVFKNKEDAMAFKLRWL